MQDVNSPILPSLAAHMDRVSECGSFAVIVRQQTPFGPCYVRYIARCNSRFCRPCATLKSKEWQKKIVGSFKKSHCVMITLTFDASAPSPLADPKYYSLAWDTFLKRLRRRYPQLRFARLVELTKSGRPHFHILVNQYIPQKYISWAFAECGGGSVADIRYVDPGRSAIYVTKYITKSHISDFNTAQFFFLTRMRAVSTSRNLFYVVPRRDDATLHSMGSTLSTAVQLQTLAHDDGFLIGDIVVDDARAGPFVFVPDPSRQAEIFLPLLDGTLNRDNILLWSLDLNSLPDEDDRFLYLPGDITLDQALSFQEKFPF